MKRKCPFCNTFATYPHNLRTHLAGKSYPGHRLTLEEAEQISKEVFSGVYPSNPKNPKTTSIVIQGPAQKQEQGPDTKTVYDSRLQLKQQEFPRAYPQDGFQYFLEELLETLVENKKLPKYQFERRIDAILHLFLPDLLTAHFGYEVETIVAEFPLKKSGNRQSTNVDYLMLMRDSKNFIKYWLFFELKTDNLSIEDDQLDAYESAMHRTMPALIRDIVEILSGTTAVSKYKYLLERLKGIPNNDQTPLRVIYLSPTIPARLRYARQLDKSQIYPLTFSEIENLPVKRFPEAWDLFRKIIMPLLRDTS